LGPRPTHDPSIDTFKIEYLLGPCVILGLVFNYKFRFAEVMWSFSIFLESVAILPQLFMLQRTGEAETITTHYLAALGAYRALYIPNWIYRYVWQSRRVNSGEFLTLYIRWYMDDSVDIIAVVAGLVQSGLYADFFYVYFTK
jgi:ER lumen protein retaining receptor